jgi:uncharacterized protein (TIGR00297 family)
MPHLNDIIVLSILAAGVLFSIRRRKLTLTAAVTGALLGWLIYAGAGYTGLAMLTVFFIMGTAATSLNRPKSATQPPPDSLPRASGNSYQPTRNAGQVIANAGIAATAGLLMIVLPSYKPLLMIMMAGSLASAAADTVSSELGMAYGRRFYNILTGRRDEKGLDGVISIEGLLFGLAGSAVIAMLYALGNQWNIDFFIILLAGTIGNITDSLLGATLERRHLLSNDTVNLLNTLTGAVAAGLIYFI